MDDSFISCLVNYMPVWRWIQPDSSPGQAILGGKVDVPTLLGKLQLNIPKGVQPGQLLVLRGKGLPKHGFLVDRGDQYVRFRVNFPGKVNDRQRAILEEFEQEEIIRENSSFDANNWLYQKLSTG